MFKLSQHSPSHISAKPARLLQALLAISLGLGLSACGPAPTSQTGPSASPSASPPTSASPSPQASSTPAMSALLKVHLQADPSLAGFATAAESFSLCLGQIASVSTQIKQNGGSETSESQPLTLAQLLKGIDLEFPVALVGVNEGRSTFFDAQGHELGFVSWQATVAEGGGTVSILLKANADTHAGEACPRLEASVTGATILGAGGNVINPIPLPNPVTTPTPGPTPTPAPSANAPALPTGLAVVEQTSSSLTLQWEFGTGPMSYNLYRDGQLVQGNYVSPNYYRFEGLNASTQYTLGVQAVNSGGASPIASLSSTTLSSGHSGSGSFSGGGSDSTHNDDTSSGTLTASREFDINTFTSARQENSRVATDNTGHFVVAWQSGQGVDGSGAGIRGRLYSGAKAQGPEFQINTYTSNDQISPDVAMRGNGSFVVVWQDQVQEGNFGIYGQRFDPDGEPVGSEFHINSYTSFNQTEPKIALDDAGNFVVVWKSVLNDFSGDGVAGQLFDSNGNRIGSEFQVNSYTTAEQFSPAVAMNDEGSFVVVWQDDTQEGNDGIYGQRYSSNGDRAGSEFRVSTYTANNQLDPDVAMDADGNFTVVWEGYDDTRDADGIYAQRFDSSGDKLGSEFIVPSITTDAQYLPRIAMQADGEFVVVYGSDDSEGDVGAVVARRFAADGEPLEDEVHVNTYTFDAQDNPSVALDEDGNFFVVWESYLSDGSDYGIAGRYYSAN